MSLEDEKRLIAEDTNTLSVTAFLRYLAAAGREVWNGWRAPPRHDQDEDDARARTARGAVDRSLATARARLAQRKGVDHADT